MIRRTVTTLQSFTKPRLASAPDGLGIDDLG